MFASIPAWKFLNLWNTPSLFSISLIDRSRFLENTTSLTRQFLAYCKFSLEVKPLSADVWRGAVVLHPDRCSGTRLDIGIHGAETQVDVYPLRQSLYGALCNAYIPFICKRRSTLSREQNDKRAQYARGVVLLTWKRKRGHLWLLQPSLLHKKWKTGHLRSTWKQGWTDICSKPGGRWRLWENRWNGDSNDAKWPKHRLLQTRMLRLQ